MFTGFKVSSLESKCVFYRPEHNANGGHLKLNFAGFLEWKDEINQQTKAQRVDERICPFVELSSLLPELWLLKWLWLSKIRFFVFFVGDNKKIVKLWAQNLSLTKWSSWVNMITRRMNPFFMYYMNFICWYISFWHFKTFKIQFHGNWIHFLYLMFRSVTNTFLHANDDVQGALTRKNMSHLTELEIQCKMGLCLYLTLFANPYSLVIYFKIF